MKESSDNSRRPRKLEEVFRDGFESAEVNPRASIWHRIEQDLEVKQAGYYKRRLVWYRSVAAASITLLILAVGYFWYDTQTSHHLKATGATLAVENNKATSPAVETQTNKVTPANEPLVAPKVHLSDQTASITATEAPLISANGLSKKAELATITRSRTKLSGKSGPPINNMPSLAREPGLTNNQFSLTDQKSNVNNKNSDLSTGSLRSTLARSGAKPTPSLSIQTDSVRLAVTEKPSLFKKDSAAFMLAANSNEAKKTANIARWELGGGTGSQYFEQNIKFADAGSNSFSLSPLGSYANAIVSKNQGGNTIEAASEEFNQNTRSAFSYRAVVAATYRLNDKWSIETGLSFAENKAQTTTSYIIYKRPVTLNNIPGVNTGNSNFNNIGSPIAQNVTIPVTIFLARLTDNYLTNANVTVEKVAPFTMYYRYRQMGLPVKLRYQQGRGKWFNFVQAGGAINVLLQTSVLSDSPKVPAAEYGIGQPSPFRKWYLTALGSVGRGLRVTEAWQIQGSLDVARSFSALTLSPGQLPDVNQNKPFYVGFGISSSYVIGKKN
ncbi:hypothetical protein AHMF7605_20100 [Adhaeribacter arboris]|uniref:Outer membrane protein beta-barrel domain-containing protein n=1 Tax=Adhaeribacter arboris TaxID=2072846 RepID=A0A2T2YJF1_9BACT|nr:hypothetical protein [Adhaeribacter arboris]PSR55643.1 hypothetical protein AHMF7605_20100 [Adhaeribacter arboris]